MGIGRRQFLKYFGAAIATAAADPLQAIVLSDDLYINRTLGVAFTKPRNWHYLSIKKFSKLKNEQVLKDDEFSEVLRGAEDPLVVLTKFDRDLEENLGPAISVYVEDNYVGHDEKLIDVLPEIEDAFKKSLKDYKHVGDPRELMISNCSSVEYFSNFLYEQSSGGVEARCRSLLSLRDPHTYTIHMFDYPEQNLTAQKEYEAFLNSVRYV